MDDVSPEMQRILDYIDGKGASDKFTEAAGGSSAFGSPKRELEVGTI